MPTLLQQLVDSVCTDRPEEPHRHILELLKKRQAGSSSETVPVVPLHAQLAYAKDLAYKPDEEKVESEGVQAVLAAVKIQARFRGHRDRRCASLQRDPLAPPACWAMPLVTPRLQRPLGW